MQDALTDAVTDDLVVGSSETAAQKPSDYTIFVLWKVIPLFMFMVMKRVCEIAPCAGAFFIVAPALVEFWIVKNREGLNLVGLRWSHEIGDRGEPRWIFYSRKDPYVPEPINSTVFWSFMLGGIFLWVGIFIASILLWTWYYTLLCAGVMTLEIVNMACFMVCHSISAKQADDVARSVLLGPTAFDSEDLEPEAEPEPETQVETRKMPTHSMSVPVISGKMQE